MTEIAIALSGFAFLSYGVSCLASDRMVLEFERYRLARFRTTVGFLELAGGLGLLAGLALPTLVAPAAAGICFLMFAGVLARLRIRDPFPQILPALVFLVLNGAIFASAAGLI